jgi:hypothetical protein
MAKQLYLRMASAAGLVGLAVLMVGLAPFLGDPSAGAGFTGTTSPFSVNRSLKGDRLPVSNSIILNAPDWRGAAGSRSSVGSRGPMPVGCDPAFSPITSPVAANVYGRCIT